MTEPKLTKCDGCQEMVKSVMQKVIEKMQFCKDCWEKKLNRRWF